MPPFSPVIEQQAQHCLNSNGGNTSEDRTFLRRKQTLAEEEEEEVALRVSDSVGNKWSTIEGTHRHHCYFHHYYSLHKIESEEKEDTEANCESNLDPYGGSYEISKLDIDYSAIDTFEENYYTCDDDGNDHHEEDSHYLHSQIASSSIVNKNVSSGSATGNKNNGSKYKWLFAIPERRVSFAVKVFGGTVLDDIKVKLIPQVHEFTSDEKRAIWYTRRELKAMRKSCLHAALVVSKDAELYCPSFLRGIEHLVEEYRHYNKLMTKTSVGNNASDANESDNDNDEHCHDSRDTTTNRRWDAVEAVLCEQERQRRMFLKTYGIAYRGTTDPEKIRSVYAIEGRTKRSQSIARANARRDEASAKEWLMEATQVATPVDDVVDHYRKTRTTSKNEFSKSIRWVFQKLLTPFLDMRDGDIYIPMGEEFFLAYA